MKIVVCLLLVLLHPLLQAVPIPGLFNTGVDDQGNVLPAGETDPHYKLIKSADRTNPGPNAIVVTPHPNWLVPTSATAWIGMAAGNGADFGYYTFRSYLDLTGLDPSTATISGQYSVDNGMVDIRLNGVTIGTVAGGGFDTWTTFSIPSGFVDGTNTLDFVMFAGFSKLDANLPSNADPTGVMVELTGSADRLAGSKIRIPTIFSTGLDANHAALQPGEVDPHYKLIFNPESTLSGMNAVVANPNGGWLSTNGVARWISSNPNQNSVGSLSGDYTYETSFDLTGFDLSKIVITGRWSTDNVGTMKLNGTTLEFSSPDFLALLPFELKEGLVQGVNTLQFMVTNPGPQPNPSGLRVDFDAFVFIPQDNTAPRLQIEPDLRLMLSGPSKRNYKIEYRESFGEFSGWVVLKSLDLIDTPFTFSDDTLPIESVGNRFYRAELLP